MTILVNEEYSKVSSRGGFVLLQGPEEMMRLLLFQQKRVPHAIPVGGISLQVATGIVTTLTAINQRQGPTRVARKDAFAESIPYQRRRI